MELYSEWREQFIYKQRYLNIDIIKCLAVFSVIGVHFILNTIDSINITNNIDIAIYLAYRQFFIICVPLFILTTGYLSIEKVTTKKHYKKTFSILGTYFFYSIITLIFRNSFMQESISAITGIKLIFTFQAIPYAWYINMFLGLYLLIPFLNKAVKNCSKKEVRLFIIILLLISVLPATWNNFNTFFGYTNILPLPNFWISIYPITYYVIGGYTKIYSINIKLRRNYYLYFALFIYLISISINHMYSDTGNISNIVKDYSSLFVLLQSVCIFIFIMYKPIDITRFKSLIITISTYTLDIYLISYIIDNLIYSFFEKNFFTNTVKDFLFSLPIIICVFLISFCVVFFLKWLKKIIVKKIKK